jgi:hypothetical protein
MRIVDRAQYFRIAMIMALLATTMSVALATPPEASAAVSNCGVVSCSNYTSRIETRHLAALSDHLHGYQLCEAVLRYDQTGTLGACWQMTLLGYEPHFRQVLKQAAQSNSCVKFYSPFSRRLGTLIVKTVEPYQGQYCKN